jgi:cytochrome c peroxidase
VRLSGDNSLSCASCHGLDLGGTDRAKTSTGIRGQLGPINSPTVYNAVFAHRQFWDGRAADLVEQASGPVHNPLEMGSNWAEVLPKLEADTAFVQQFLATYPALTGDHIADAIAAFESTLVTPNARFDQFLMGKADAITAEERSGYELFKANACATCHVGKAIGGQSFEYMGHRRDYFADRGNVGEVDFGRFNVTKESLDRHKFKVPTLRNVAQTAPYFHDASAADLAAAVRTMSKYNGAREFAPAEVDQLVAFLKTLTGEFEGKPVV